ncbi:MAG: branched-chain amino acid ABC transporter ATP-binding protein, partial [Proteobacteria bacterium]|nr:branched-chain amino acid ABC transporter ATP-binding protein [Pseudomonadota bacterium]
GLAPIIIDQIYEIIENLREQGRTILLVEESPNRIIDLADHIHLLDTGSIVWNGTGQELQAQPQILETYLGG